MTRPLFLSDNASPAHPEILAALGGTVGEHLTSYGDDPLTRSAERRIREFFDRDCGVYFVYNGTGANVAALRTVTRPFEAVICTEMAHINEDEAGACEAIGGFKLLPLDRRDGRLSPEDLDLFAGRRGFEHTSQPAVVSLTQATEVGTIYTPDHLRRLCDKAHSLDMVVHMDGARIANAAVSWRERARREGRDPTPAQALREISCDAGIDVLSFGATKNGLLFGEAVLFFDRALEESFRFFRKQTTQLHSKMRYIAVQFERYLRDDLWFANAARANSLAARLGGAVTGLPGVEQAHPVEANGVFLHLPPSVIPALQDEFGFYLWDESTHLARLMVSWDSTEEVVDAFAARCRELCLKYAHPCV
ncbi:MAG: threonine aldolase [Spirochaetaceae bacterium]|nr:MAG: threonine aldolase [Spirochaetaceae bacterium]